MHRATVTESRERTTVASGRPHPDPSNALLFCLGGVVLFSQVWGGGTRQGFAGDVAVTFLAAALLALFLVVRVPQVRLSAALVMVIIAIGIAIAIGPAHHWFVVRQHSGLLGEIARTSVDGSGVLPPTASPYASGAALLSILAPLSVFLTTRTTSASERLKLTWLLLGLGTVSLGFGFLQMAQGPESPLRLFEFTNPTEAVGLFANRNHFAAQLYVTLLLATVWVATAIRMLGSGRGQTPALLGLTLAAVLVLAIVSGLALARSRAGVFLAMAALIGVFFLLTTSTQTASARDAPRSKTSNRLVLVALAALILFVLQFGLTRILTRFEKDPFDDLRWPLAAVTWETAVKALPFGTGLGTFVPVYGAVERGTNLLPAYANRAHNDFLELMLETGLVGLAVAALFMGWLVWRTIVVWARPSERTADHTEILLQRSCTLIVWLLLAHSLVDYPLRTTALAVVFAFCAGVLSPARVAEAVATRPIDGGKARPSRETQAGPALLPGALARDDRTTPSTEAWPDAWRPTRSPPNRDS